ncbi:bestrophin-4 isoform X2 [Sitodiplosis mosellana]|uniref:bestrophin-4 isoform X2 n=1 Tax=Sitodiplosis mosellana TaxID=263140 RepID=UPI002444CFAB|nr:bestrophin-4 isoform X2 [Sitodiplosis mosellana]XP_055299667.1 bestrophin-4 isoform X2 [Sitodiplosis mosellana]XP_055299668.1 bestrophin-4 isoform X2 [Sitodiplosis mosellana]
MTVTYTAEVATCRGFGCFLKLLFRWRGSIYKLVWLDLVCFLFLYYTLNIIYRTALDDDQKKIFEDIVKYCSTYSNLIPLSFVLGFYVTVVMTRWWNQYVSIPWPDTFAVFVSANIHGQDERGRLMRRIVMRYVCLCLTMVLSNVSPRVKKRFPTLQHLVEAGLLEENEKFIMESFNSKFTKYSKHWMPIVWASSIITRARKEGRIRDDFAVKTLIDELNKFRGQTGLLISYDTISIPLVYTQVVTLAVYSFFLTSVMGSQWFENKPVAEGVINRVDLYFPVFTMLQFFFYMGWLKVAESLINPFGEDDDDFEVNWIIDRNLQVSYMIVDEMHHEHPELIKDQYWDTILPSDDLPYTEENLREQHPQPSTANIEAPKRTFTQSLFNTISSSPKIDELADDNASGIHFTVDRRMSKNRLGSTNSIHSNAGSVPRVNTVTNVFRRFFSREDSRSPNTPEGSLPTPTLGHSSSTISMAGPKFPQGTMRIADQVIEEVDEQMTITSNRGHDSRPTAQSLFAPNNEKIPTRSQPIDVPGSNRNNIEYERVQSVMQQEHQPYLFPSDAFFSSSAPEEGVNIPLPKICVEKSVEFKKRTPTGSTDKLAEEDVDCTTANDNPTDDDFEQLRLAREKERLEKQKQKIARTISHQTGGIPIDSELLIEQLTNSKGDGINRTSYIEPNS